MTDKFGNVTNTTKQPASLHLLDAMMLGPSEAIEAQEAAGQAELVNSTVLPYLNGRGLRGRDSAGDDQEFLDLGFTFGDPVEGDELFRQATLPEGWEKKPSGHSMWSHIVDERGMPRVAIFYKAAFYDRDAFMRIVTKPGSDVSGAYIYQEGGKVDLNWDVFTDEEQAQAVENAQGYLETAERWGDDKDHPDRLERAREILTKAGVES